MTSMVYVDLNPVQAGIADELQNSNYTYLTYLTYLTYSTRAGSLPTTAQHNAKELVSRQSTFLRSLATCHGVYCRAATICPNDWAVSDQTTTRDHLNKFAYAGTWNTITGRI